MATYNVIWRIEVEAENHDAAASLARDYQLSPDTTATVFEVQLDAENEPWVTIDLLEKVQS